MVAIVEPVPGAAAPDLDALQEHCRAHLAGYKVPRAAHVVDAVVRTAAGKADYAWARRDRDGLEHEPDRGAVQYVDGLRCGLSEHWRTMRGVTQVRPTMSQVEHRACRTRGLMIAIRGCDRRRSNRRSAACS